MEEEELNNLIDVTERVRYLYVAIPREYVCVYHRILVLLADYGTDMIQDCKASCTSRNSSIIECFNMFNAAVAAHKLGQMSLANTLMNYVKTKITQIYRGDDNSPSFTFPVDENGMIVSVVSCDDPVRIYVNPDDGELFTRIFRTDGGIQQQFQLGIEDEPEQLIAEHEQKPFDYNVRLIWRNHTEDGVVSTTKKELRLQFGNIDDIDGNRIFENAIRYDFTLNSVYYEQSIASTTYFVVNKFTGIKDMNIVVYYNNRGVIHTIPVEWGVDSQ